jgi:phage repressor protein C with HTH and peptisase S24 domain
MIALEAAYSWLNRYDISHLRSSSDSLINQIGNVMDEGHPDEARGLVQQLHDLAYKLRDDQEVTEALVECAHSHFELDDIAESETILVEAVSRAWSDLHRRAVIQWMQGCVQWRSLPNRQNAVISWRNSLADFERLARQPGLAPVQHAWYQETSDQLEQSLLEALEQVGSYMDMDAGQSSGKTKTGASEQQEPVSTTLEPSEPTVTQTSEVLTPSETFTTKTPDTSIPPESNAANSFDILQLFTVSDVIPAGDFGPSGIDPFPIGTVEIDRLTINGHPYSIHSTRGRRIINLPFDQKLSVVKVKGDSMDQENITAQDYVILHRVDVPANGDIVMAEIVGIDSHATIKRYFKEKGTITLTPHSRNPVHKPFVFKKVNEGFYIRGVVVAVLKPV